MDPEGFYHSPLPILNHTSFTNTNSSKQTNTISFPGNMTFE